MTEMAIVLLRAFAEALRLPANAFDALYGDKPNEHIKLIRYPGQDNTKATRVSARIKIRVSEFPAPGRAKRIAG
jgi:isopenicillin N synthase-like dioxygenase